MDTCSLSCSFAGGPLKGLLMSFCISLSFSYSSHQALVVLVTSQINSQQATDTWNRKLQFIIQRFIMKFRISKQPKNVENARGISSLNGLQLVSHTSKDIQHIQRLLSLVCLPDHWTLIVYVLNLKAVRIRMWIRSMLKFSIVTGLNWIKSQFSCPLQVWTFTLLWTSSVLRWIQGW